ncbi:MAG: polymer-forming cytoskeletal protein [Deltaproteobacteria bacterium]|nr:polymer-forming cytoskeletal protein [Deltaproteobacteria bacterium]
MATMKTNPGLESNLTIIGDSVRVQGNLSGDEDLHVLGRVDGRIDLQRTLVVAPSGIVKAEVNVKNAIVSGVVVGNIHASESIEITREGRMVGDIYAPRVIIVDGASFRGTVDMGDIANMPVRKPGSERARPTPAAPARPAVVAPRAAPARAASPATPPPAPARPTTTPTPTPPPPVAAPKVMSAPAIAAAPPAPPPDEPEEETVEEEVVDALSGDPPAAKGLPHRAQKARVIVKRK